MTTPSPITPDKRAWRNPAYGLDGTLARLGTTAGHFNLLVEAGILPKGLGRYEGDKLAWYWGDVSHLYEQLRTVYFVGINEFIKIGYTTDLARRLKDFQTSLPYPVTLLHSFAGNTVLERFLHGRFADYRGQGEWFRSCPELVDFIEAMKR